MLSLGIAHCRLFHDMSAGEQSAGENLQMGCYLRSDKAGA
jgi:hypothetical protein